MMKSALESKTIGFNVVSGLIASVVWPFLPLHWKNDPETTQAIIAGISLVNIGLRFVTSTAIGRKGNA